MKKIKQLLPVLFLGLTMLSCSKDEVPETPVNPTPTPPVAKENIEVEEFIYRGLNDIYLYKADVPALADDYFDSEAEKREYLESFDSPEELFDELLAPQDRFSFMMDDYVALEKMFSGVRTTTGMDYGLYKFSNSDGVYGVVRYVLPGTSAAEQGIERGDIFTAIDGVDMNVNNYQDLLGKDSYTITLATISNNSISQTDETVSLEKREYNENPVFISKVIEAEGKSIAYLMYNSFTADYDADLNAAFAEFKSAAVDELVLDLRYNGGGSVETAVDLSSMITGQFNGEIFMKEQWNESYQNYFEQNNPGFLENRFNPEIRTGELINSLNLNKVYVLTTGSSASASELVINGLDPYINVVQIGTTTTGKFQASVTLYDSPNFGRENANESHTYAIQPLVLKSVNVEGKSDYINGLAPDIEVSESLANMGILGDPSEPLLNTAINHILGKSSKRPFADDKFSRYELVGEAGMEIPNYQRMYIEEVPAILE